MIRDTAQLIAFDIGGTLMEYTGMPLSWVEYYVQGFKQINSTFQCNASADAIDQSVQTMRAFNPRINFRDKEYVSEFIFEQVLQHWNASMPMKEAIDCFFAGMNLQAEIFPDSIRVLNTLKSKGCVIAALTDLPTAMPDEMFQKDIEPLMRCFDLYVSSQSCGYRKPNPYGLHHIADRYGLCIKDIVYIGDEEKDRLTARNAGCTFLKIDRTGLHDDADMTNLDGLFVFPQDS